ncbi:MAG: Mur ligase family protein [Planctomycetota bacterium]
MPAPTTNRPVGVRLTDVLAPIYPPTADCYATTCTNQASQCREGDVYVAPDGDAATVLPLVANAIANGASVVVTSQLLPVAQVPQYVVADTREAFATLCHALVGNPAEQLHCTAIAGGLGKSSVIGLLNSIYRVAGYTAATADDDQSFDGSGIRKVDGKSSSPAAAASWLGRSNANGCDDALIEASQHASVDRRFAGITFQTVCVTNLTTKTPSTSRQSERAKIAWACKQLADDGTLVLNADDQDCCRLLSEVTGEAITFGFGETADVRGQILQRHTAGQVLLIRYGSESVAIETSTVGDAHASNCLAAAATALAQGISLKHTAHGIESAPGVTGVMQPVVCGQAFPVYLDRAASPAAVAEATRSVAKVANHRVLTVVAEQVSRESAELSINAARVASEIVLVPRQVAGSLGSVDGVRVVEDRFTAIALALALADPGDAVVVLGCEPSTSGEDSDEQTVRQLLQLRLENEEEVAAAG